VFEIFGLPPQALFSLMLLGAINGAFYAMMSLGLALIFGMLNIVNFSHGTQYMMGAFAAWMLLSYAGIGYWPSLIIAPILVALSGLVLERLFLRHLYHLDHLYGFLLTFGVSLLIEGVFRHNYGVSGQPFDIPDSLTGGFDLGFMFLPTYRAWVIVASLTVCLATWYVVERTRFGAYLRASTENPVLVRAFGINVPLLVTLTYMLGVGLAAFAGVLAAPIYQVSSIMGANIIPVIFAVVVIGGLGSIMGCIITGFVLGLFEAFTRIIYPEASTVVIFIVMVGILLIRPQGLFGVRG
jgi:branched-chain amino acid transport system permease protein